MYKYYKYVLITLMWCISVASFASDNIQKTTNNFNFKNLSAQQKYGALDYGVYDPAEARRACRQIPRKAIWDEGQINAFPPPEPLPSDCEMSTQMAYGCTNYSSKTGHALTKSVVAIMLQNPSNLSSWIVRCTGTIIDNQWVLTGANCVTNAFNTSLEDATSIIVVPWQELEQSGGVPTKLDSDEFGAYSILKVRSVNIPKAYHGEGKYPRDTYIPEYNPDLALLKIEPIKPYMGLEPIPVVNKSLLNTPETPAIKAGYGYKEDKTIDGELRYRKSYYMTNIYDGSWKGGKSGNYGNIYMLDSKPVEYEGILSAWSFSGRGDSGGPVLSYNASTRKFQVEGVLSAGFFCDYNGYFAKLPYPYSEAASTTYPQNYDFITSVMSGAATQSQVRCNGECNFKTLYVMNQISNDIYSYQFFGQSNNLFPGLKTPTGNYPTQIAFSQIYNKAFVTNYVSNSISEYDVNLSDGSLMNRHNIVLPDNSGPVDAVFSGNMMVVLARNSHSLLQYYLDEKDGSFKFLRSSPFSDDSTKATHLNAMGINNGHYVLVTHEEYGRISNKRRGEVAFYQSFIDFLLDTGYKLRLTDDMGTLIEIKPFGSPHNQKLYILTTNGVYIYEPVMNYNKLVAFQRIARLVRDVAPSGHIVPLYKNSFAISTRNNVSLYEVVQDNRKIVFKNDLVVPEPVDMAFDNGSLNIISSPNLSLYIFTISYPNLTVSAEPKIVQTGAGPSIVKINQL